MKKGLCILLSAMMIALTLTACSKKGGDDAEVKTTLVNEEGSAYVKVTQKNGEEKTDKEGENVTSVLSDKEAEKIEKESSKAAGKTSAPENIAIDEKALESFASEEDFEMTAAPEDILPEGTTTKKTTLFEDKVKKIIKTGKFTLDMNITSGKQKTPVKLVFDKDRMYASLAMNGMPFSMIFMNDTAYLILPPALFLGAKVYMEYPDADNSMKEMFDSFDSISNNGGKYVGSTKVKDGNKEYTCEEYKSDDGTVFKYYFLGNDWKRYECKTPDGDMVYEINTFSGKVDSNVFSLKGYTKVTEDMLETMLGGGTGSTTKKTTTTKKSWFKK